MADVPRVLFLPGASGDPGFWLPVLERLPGAWDKRVLGWPGAGDQPHDPAVTGFGDLIDRASVELLGGTDIVAQSMGSVIAARLAVAHPRSVRRLVLVGAPAGGDSRELGAVDWRPAYRLEHPNAAAWVTEERIDPVPAYARIPCPTLLIWGAEDDISPPAAGLFVASLVAESKLELVAGGGHDVARAHADLVAPLIAAHLAS